VIELVEHQNIEVILIGGRLFKHSVVSVGAPAIEDIGRIRADAYFMGETGIHPDVYEMSSSRLSSVFMHLGILMISFVT
jgi:DeoR/GlpR family transcriptional regulator of sugar metabolism